MVLICYRLQCCSSCLHFAPNSPGPVPSTTCMILVWGTRRSRITGETHVHTEQTKQENPRRQHCESNGLSTVALGLLTSKGDHCVNISAFQMKHNDKIMAELCLISNAKGDNKAKMLLY